MKKNEDEDNKFTWGDSIIISKEAPNQFHPREFGSICGFYKIKSDDIYIIYDDLDLRPGQIKISQNKSSGGHNGIKSIIESLGNSNFFRFRIGIGQPKFFQSVPSFVLDKPTKAEQEKISTSAEQIINGLELTVKEGILSAQNKYN